MPTIYPTAANLPGKVIAYGWHPVDWAKGLKSLLYKGSFIRLNLSGNVVFSYDGLSFRTVSINWMAETKWNPAIKEEKSDA